MSSDRTANEELVEKQLSRLNGLMHPDRTRITLHGGEPERAPDELGALAGVGFHSHDPHIVVSVYVFQSWSQHQSVAKELENELSEDGVRVITATNGPMLLVGHTRIDGPGGTDARFALTDIASAFAGDE
jgi:hypothetical protein